MVNKICDVNVTEDKKNIEKMKKVLIKKEEEIKKIKKENKKLKKEYKNVKYKNTKNINFHSQNNVNIIKNDIYDKDHNDLKKSLEININETKDDKSLKNIKIKDKNESDINLENMQPKKIKEHRKEKYPSKRNNYRKYKNATWEWKNVFNEIDVLKENNVNNFVSIISQKYNIPYETLRKKYNKYINDNIIPSNKQENRGGYNKYFCENEEKDLFEYFYCVFIKGNLIFTNEHLQLLATQKYLNKQKELNKNNPNYVEDINFVICESWVSEFKKKWNLSSLKTNLRRTAVNIDQNDINIFIVSSRFVNKHYDKDFIFNLDETFWKIMSGNFSTIGITNSDHQSVITNVDPKSGFTTIFIISASGLLLKPSIILKGKTKACLKKIQTVSDEDVNKLYSISGWVNVELMINLLGEIYKLTKGHATTLILDKYGVHENEIIKKTSNDMNINLLFIPAGMTSILQPLDINFNGPVKSIGKSLSNKILLKDPYAKYTLVNSINTMIDASKKIKKDVIIDSFSSIINL